MNNMMRKNNNRGGNNKHRSGGGNGPRRYNNNSGGGNGGSRGPNDSQNIQRQKHHATQQLGKYSDMARNAQINGDRVDVEYYLQHVDHYTRILTDIAGIEAERHAQQRESQIIPGGPNDPNAQQYHQENGQSQDQSGNDSQQSPAEAQGGQDHQQADTSQPQQPQQQSRPRQQRPRQQHQEPSGNGSREANANHEEIPLPGSILPPI